jgi:hypothetical protein
MYQDGENALIKIEWGLGTADTDDWETNNGLFDVGQAPTNFKVTNSTGIAMTASELNDASMAAFYQRDDGKLQEYNYVIDGGTGAGDGTEAGWQVGMKLLI